ncbi:uncharacterized protein LOC134190373 [Corticium candelabrum]|uniref:uncharacterized protein LOC134190373 n=1 Tax=Corticium candelabrum TaxID=121492 RepID=UPI002E270557|nr:uncharacterized protein LOC134190373 [Corticium candelabrum]
MANVKRRLAFTLLSCLLFVYDAAGDGHLINPDGIDCASFTYDQQTDTCCHMDCAGGTCRGPGPRQCTGKCGTWTEDAGPVEIIEGKGFYLTDGDVGTGSMTQKAAVVVHHDDPLPDDVDDLLLDVDLTGYSHLSKTYYPSEQKLEIVGEDAPSLYEKILNMVTFDNKANKPSDQPRKVCFATFDGKHSSRLFCVNVGVQLVNNHPPEIKATAHGVPYQEEGDAVTVLGGLVITDLDHPELQQFYMHSATVTVEGGVSTDQVYVDVTQSNGAITLPQGNGRTEVILRGPAPLSVFETVLLTTKFESADDEPNLNAREIRFNINDGIHQSDDTVRVEVQGINDRKPEIMPGSTENPFKEEERTPAKITPSLILDDPDNDPVDYIFNVTVSICQDGVCPDRIDWSPDIAFETLNVTRDTALEVTYGQQNGRDDYTRLVITGKKDKAEYQRVLRTLAYANSRGNISCPISRIIYIMASDGNNSGSARTTVRIEFTNDHPPVVSATIVSFMFKEDGTGVNFAPDIELSDPDERCNTSILKELQFQVHNYDVGHEIMAVDEILAQELGIEHRLETQGDLVALVLEGVAETRDYQKLARTVAYQNTKDEPTLITRDISVRAGDGEKFSNIIHVNVSIMPRNDQEPLLQLRESSFTYTENGLDVMLGPAMLTDADSTPKDRNIIWMSVTLRNKQDGEKEDLKFDNTIVERENAITVGADDDGFRIEAIDQINGAPIELFDEVIDSIYYSNIASNPVPVGEPTGGDREILFQRQHINISR